ncbi:BQ5605_C009g05724 [Microbotryum silenes-dioicae]|uniref:BQ5605_C009g05724 protein n=1 Tax=Microbotryum silenes-dioicae TaxID=796604 RepID=A0A2X0ME89_9BASI|nr:BQ5605_C009g05724 [Microbotryum silenes-dioicae]
MIAATTICRDTCLPFPSVVQKSVPPRLTDQCAGFKFERMMVQ